MFGRFSKDFLTWLGYFQDMGETMEHSMQMLAAPPLTHHANDACDIACSVTNNPKIPITESTGKDIILFSLRCHAPEKLLNDWLGYFGRTKTRQHYHKFARLNYMNKVEMNWRPPRTEIRIEFLVQKLVQKASALKTF